MRISDKQNPSPIAQQLREHMAEKSISQLRVAKAIGLSAPVISQYLSDTYKGDTAAVEAKVRQWLDVEAERAERPKIQSEIIRTKTLIHIAAVLDAAVCDQDMVVITGPSGAGKTTAVTHYAKEHSSAILIEADNGYTSVALFAELCDKLGLQSKGTLHDLLRRVIDRLSESGRLLIIDEAEQLKHNTLDLVRRVHDKAHIPIALVGLERLNMNLKGDRNHFTYLWNRIGLHRKVDHLTQKEEESFVRSRLGEIPEDILNLIRRESQHNARILVKLLKWCLRLCKKNNCELDAEIVLEASNLVTLK